ncbi:MAG: D-aminoacyl-tRNA deacylase [Pseudomonadota bacterium]
MRAVVQRVSSARVEVAGRVVGAIGAGLLVLLGVGQADTPAQAVWLAEKIAGLRVFSDADDKLNLSLLETGGACLVVSQFTLWGDCAKGRRPSFARAAKGEQARPLYEAFAERLRGLGLAVATGSFGAMMDVHLVNQGPVTLLINSDKCF